MSLKDELNGFLKVPDLFFGIPPPSEGLPDVGVIGVPYDLTSSYSPGCRFGPDAIRRATTGVWSHSQPSLAGISTPTARGFLSKAITLEDVGDLEVDLRQPEPAMYDISDAVYRVSQKGTYLLFLGGDHFITYPIVRGLKRGSPGEYGLIWFDAHADFYPDYAGYKLSHATTLRRIVHDNLVTPQNIAAHDLRSAIYSQIEELLGSGSSWIADLNSFRSAVIDIAQRVDAIHITIDLDVLRPEVVPGVAHPESGGLTPDELFEFLRVAFATGKVRSADIVELNPLLDKTGLATITARDVVKEILAGFAYQKS
ncbi:MAG: arginase family protein [Candidatus Thorarchaeota archaeon]|nr:arginase family protein [Candidatus Thorarchaeota archaeon]